jgi:hypothetical protein
MRAKRIAPHRKTIFVRRTNCKNFCARVHTNVYNFVNPKDEAAALKLREEQDCGAFRTAAPAAQAVSCSRDSATAIASPSTQKVQKRQRGVADESSPPGSAYTYIRSPPPTATIWPLM